MYCTNCGKILSDNAKVCLNCGVDISDGNRFCPSCGAEHDPKASICLKCGVSLKSEKNESDSGFGRYITNGFKNAFKIKGRMARAEFWWFCLAVFLVQIAFGVTFNGFLALLSTTGVGVFLALLLLFIPGVVGILAWLIMGFATIRRLHDTGRSGWYSLCYFLSVLTFGISGIVAIILACLPGEECENEYGPVPYK